MKIIIFANQKGGVGKTTVCAHVAVAAEAAGAGPVAIVDADPQGSLTSWWNKRQADTPALAAIDLADPAASLAQLAKSYKLAMIDTPPAIGAGMSPLIAAADLVVIPLRPGPHDLEAVGGTLDLCEATGRRFCFLINAAIPRGRLTDQAARAVGAHGPVAPVTIHSRSDFIASMIDGRTAGEIETGGRSAIEMADLWKYIDQQINGRRRGK